MRYLFILLCGLSLVGASCSAQQSAPPDNAPVSPVPVLVPEVLESYPHDVDAFTQGLLLEGDALFESTGLYGSSSLREVDPETGEVLREEAVPGAYFAEGLALVGDRLIQLTWQKETAFVYDKETFESLGTFSYSGEGWGLCFDGAHLYMSDGSATISRRDAETFEVEGELEVTLRGEPLVFLNELECVDDTLYANVWQTDAIVEIDKESGRVVAAVDASGLLSEEEREGLRDGAVLNGIAYDRESETFLITGKLWPKLFRVRFVPR